MNAITLTQYLGPYYGHPDVIDPVLARARILLEAANAALLLAEKDGVVLRDNPLTKSLIAGSGNGGFRPNGSSVGAPSSRHKSGEALDLYDPERQISSWSLANGPRLRRAGIAAIEDPRWTPTWCHWQIVRVPSGRFAFIPSNDPPLAAAPAKWVGTAVA